MFVEMWDAFRQVIALCWAPATDPDASANVGRNISSINEIFHIVYH
jgi:hypothetical protein